MTVIRLFAMHISSIVVGRAPNSHPFPPHHMGDPAGGSGSGVGNGAIAYIFSPAGWDPKEHLHKKPMGASVT